MRKQVFGRQLQRDANERKALFKSLMDSLVIYESIQTTEAKAKAIKGQFEKAVTKAKKGGVEAEKALQAYFSLPTLKRLMTEIAPRFATRPGGYTRIIKVGNRLRDNAKMVVLELVEKKQPVIAGEVVTAKNVGKQEADVVEAASPKENFEKKNKEKKVTKKKISKKKSSSGGK